MGYPARGSELYVGYAPSDTKRVPKDPTLWMECLGIALEPDVAQIKREILRPTAVQYDSQVLLGARSVKGNIKTEFHPEQGMQLLNAILGNVTHNQLGGTAAYKHTFTGSDTVPSAEGFTIFESMDIIEREFYGCFPTKLGLAFDIGKSVEATYDFIGKDVVSGVGTGGTSRGQNAITFTVTLVLNTSDQIKLNVDGAGIVEITLTAGAYATSAALVTMINNAINSTSTLLNTMGDPKVACFVDANNKLNFYSATKGAASSVAWTAGTHDASTLLGKGTPVEAVGAATLPTPTYSALQPFIFHQATLLVDGSSVDVEKLSLSIDIGLQAKNVLGQASLRDVLLGKNRVVTGSIDKWFEDETIINKFRALTSAALKIQLRSGVQVGATAYFYDCDIWLNNIRYGNPFPKPSGTGPFKQSIPFTAYYDVTYKDVQIDITNSLTTW